ncbi:MAG: ParA family protein [Clostridia bacterium]|nr:ParA family protein [Clostridia bacterium]
MIEKLKKRITIICGHYGAGKTNVAVNLAKAAADSGRKVAIADLDVVNPYFRTADNAAELREKGIRCIVPEFANTNVDIPSIPAEFLAVFDGDAYSVVDVGGDDGAIALSVYKDRFEHSGYDMLYVYNACRPLTATVEEAIESLRAIEDMSRLKFTGIVNNTNLGGETTAATVEKGSAVCKALSAATGVPYLGSAVFKGIKGLAEQPALLMDNATKQLF